MLFQNFFIDIMKIEDCQAPKWQKTNKQKKTEVFFFFFFSLMCVIHMTLVQVFWISTIALFEEQSKM